jgi:nucleotide-binding universal stress UspA family protein
VLDTDHLAAVLRTQHLDEVLEEAQAASEAEIARASSGGDRPDVEVVQALTIAEGLDAARRAHDADGIIIARVARRESHHLFRLGDVGRRLLRRLASPVIVVPPTFTARSAGTGPVVTLTSLSDDSLPACRIAARLAANAGRALTMAHVSDEDGSADASLAAWLDEHEIWPDATAVLHGELAEAGLAFTEMRHAPLLAIGAGPLKGLQRLLGAKVARRLAAVAEVPLLVVPQHWTVEARSDLSVESARPQEDSELGAPTP